MTDCGHSGCREQTFESSDYCILHTRFPEYVHSIEYERLDNLKNQKVQYKVRVGDLNFEGAILRTFKLSNQDLGYNGLILENALILDDLELVSLVMRGNIDLSHAIIQRNLLMDGVKIQGGDMTLYRTLVEGSAELYGIELTGELDCRELIVNHRFMLGELKCHKNAYIAGAKFWGADFGNSIFDKDLFLEDTEVTDILDIQRCDVKGLIFADRLIVGDLPSRENTFRKAAVVNEQGGYRYGSDKYFFQQMAARRKKIKTARFRELKTYLLQLYSLLHLGLGEFALSSEKELVGFINDARKSEIPKILLALKATVLAILEAPVQYFFGYGVKPLRLSLTWIGVIALFALAYYLGNGITDLNTFSGCLWFSVTTAITPGFAGYKPVTGIFEIIASVEAIIGTIFWATFIATFARKFMR